MTPLDIALLGIIGLCAILGFARGLIRRVGSLVGVVLGVVVALKYGALIGEHLRSVIGSSQARTILASFMVFVAVYLGVVVIAGALHRLIHKVKLGCLNRFAGAALGGTTAAIPLGAALLLAVAYVPATRPPIAASRVAVVMMNGSRALLGLMPEQAKAAFRSGKKEVDELIEKYRKLPDERVRKLQEQFEEV